MIGSSASSFGEQYRDLLLYLHHKLLEENNSNQQVVQIDVQQFIHYLEVYWPCAGGLSAVNAIGTQLRDPINSGLTRWRMAVS